MEAEEFGYQDCMKTWGLRALILAVATMVCGTAVTIAKIAAGAKRECCKEKPQAPPDTAWLKQDTAWLKPDTAWLTKWRDPKPVKPTWETLSAPKFPVGFWSDTCRNCPIPADSVRKYFGQ